LACQLRSNARVVKRTLFTKTSRSTNAVVDILSIPADSLVTFSDDFGEQRCPAVWRLCRR